MKIQLRKDIYTTVVGGTRKKTCAGCAFLSWDEGICNALVPVYKVCPAPGKVFQYVDKSPEVFDL
jgi:hypothetical protein